MAIFKIKKANGRWDIVGDGGGGSMIDIDATLTQSGKAADAKAVGDAINNLGSLAEKDNVELSDLSSAIRTSLAKADSAIQTENDPTVPAWAKSATKPTYTAAEVGITTTTEVTSGSSDLVTSGAVYNAISQIDTVDPSNFVQQSNGAIVGSLAADANAVTNLSTPQLRNIFAGTADISVVASSLKDGDIYLRYAE